MSVRFPCSLRVCWLGLIGLALLLRLGVMWNEPAQLTEDRDLYLGIAKEIRAGHGYSTPGSEPPRATAFRPPLYPLMLILTGGQREGIAALHLLLAAVTVVATGLAAERFASQCTSACRSARLLAAGIVAIDPLLVLYSGQPMTETLCSCLTAMLLLVLAGWNLSKLENPTGVTNETGRDVLKHAILTGVLWGLCLLARPTYAAAFGLWLAGMVLMPRRMSESFGERLRSCSIIGVVAIAVLSPWIIRNWNVFGHPIATTTHGGYTLWLANNPVYYAEVIEGGAAAWDGESLNRWQTQTSREMEDQQIRGEIAQDHWQSQTARSFIRENPLRFGRACVYRAMRFWSVWPGRGRGPGLPAAMLWIVAGGYLAVWIGSGLSVWRAIQQRDWRMLVNAGSLILGFFAVHLVYWTDARMRAPIMPAVAILFAVGMSSRHPDSRQN